MTESKKRSRPNRLGMYEDIREVLDGAIEAGGGTYELETHGKAVHWRHRAYTFRKLFAEIHYPTPSKYDVLSFKKIPDESNVVVIVIGQQRGVFTPANAAPPVLAEKKADLMLEAAKELFKDLGIDEPIL